MKEGRRREEEDEWREGGGGGKKKQALKNRSSRVNVNSERTLGSRPGVCKHHGSGGSEGIAKELQHH